jgi:hypothetical protein
MAPFAAETTVVTLELSLSGLESGISLVTAAVLVQVPACSAVTSKLTVAEASISRSPRSQKTSVVPLQEPWVGVASCKVNPAGNKSLTCTPVAATGPRLVTAIVKVKTSPTWTLAEEAVFTTSKSVKRAS